METLVKTLNIEALNQEYKTWLAKFGTGRNKQDLRFGQYIWAMYNMKPLFPSGSNPNDGFYAENAHDAYGTLATKLYSISENEAGGRNSAWVQPSKVSNNINKSNKATRTTYKSDGTPATQCNGATKTGNRCRNITKSLNGYCHLH